jgi:hypothetical protein
LSLHRLAWRRTELSGSHHSFAIVRAAQERIRTVQHWHVNKLPLIVRFLFVVNADCRVFAFARDPHDCAPAKGLSPHASISEYGVVTSGLAGLWV